jgi:hypothetical protein
VSKHGFLDHCSFICQKLLNRCVFMVHDQLVKGVGYNISVVLTYEFDIHIFLGVVSLQISFACFISWCTEKSFIPYDKSVEV